MVPWEVKRQSILKYSINHPNPFHYASSIRQLSLAYTPVPTSYLHTSILTPKTSTQNKALTFQPHGKPPFPSRPTLSFRTRNKLTSANTSSPRIFLSGPQSRGPDDFQQVGYGSHNDNPFLSSTLRV
jgi:hypothetical protein